MMRLTTIEALSIVQLWQLDSLGHATIQFKSGVQAKLLSNGMLRLAHNGQTETHFTMQAFVNRYMPLEKEKGFVQIGINL